MKSCKVLGCDTGQRFTKGLCNKHYKRHLKGLPLDLEPLNNRRSLEERYWERVAVAGPDECWLWTAVTKKSKICVYGSIKKEGRSYSAHRVGYALSVGIDPTELPSHIPVHHKCGVSLCQNPKHLQATTSAENTAEMLERAFYLKRIAYLESVLDTNGIEY